MLNLEDQGALIAVIKNKDKKKKDTKLYVSPDEDGAKNGGPVYHCTEGETLQIVPNTKAERQCIYICGQSGSGKSYFASQYIREYKKSYPKNEIYCISSISEDSSIDSLKPKRIDVLDPEFMLETFTSDDFKNSLIIFDDVDVFPKKIRDKVMTIVNNILQIGRHSNVSIVFTTHSPTNGQDTKILLAESNIITIFPQTTGNRSLKYLLDNYLGLDRHQILKIKKLKSRAVSIIRGFPQVVLAEKECFLVHNF
jgi:hypothetical protein